MIPNLSQLINKSSSEFLRIPIRFKPQRILQTLCYLLLASLILFSMFFPAQRAYPYLAYSLFLASVLPLLMKYPQLLVLHAPRALDVVPLLSIFVWTYGVLMGLLGGYPNSAVFSNFAGMVFYGAYYLLLLSRADVQATLRFIVLLSIFFSIGLTVNMFSGAGLSLQLDMFEDIGLSAVRLGWSSSLSLSLVVVGLSYARLIDLLPSSREYVFFQSGKLLAVSAFFLGSVPVFGSASKGFILAYGVLIGLLTLARFFPDIRYLRVRPSILIIVLGGGAILVWFFEEIFAVAHVLILLEKSPDSVRSIQGAELIADFTWFGKGLGASLSSGYSRDALGYGFELTFHNIIHKFGLITLLHLPMMIAPLLLSAYAILRHRQMESSIVAFALMMFVIPGYGNPILHVPLNAFLNCFALYLVSRSQQGVVSALTVGEGG